MDANIHYYGHVFPPAHFTGVRGWWIRVLNRVRYELDCRVQYHVMRCLKAEGIDDVLRVKYQEEQAARQVFREGRSDRADLNPVVLPSRPLTPEEASAERLKRLLAPGRAQRYARGRRVYVVGEGFEPVIKEGSNDESGQSATEDRAVVRSQGTGEA